MKKYLTIQNILNLLLIVGVIIGNIFYILGDKLLLKTITSAGFFLIGLINLYYSFKHNKSNTLFAMIMTVGLLFAMLGDILLGMNFIVGAIFFAIGHVFYFVAYCLLCKFKWTDLIAGGIIALASVLVILLVPVFDLDVTMKIVVIFYAIIISFMLGKAVTNLIRERNIINLIILIGSVLFFFSDLMLLFDNFSIIEAGQTFGNLCLATYYPAEILLAISLIFLPKQKEESAE
ncbi:MAG: lysoplasmalogenase [Clostridia bacterium]|nr:lysoplasmalogenase [Clostridia bacterium]MBQ8792379.1 lysoplasmalogenase [Clostridia bacterium]